MSRDDGRANDVHRPVTIQRRFTRTAPGSVLIEMGGTRVLCTASVEQEVPAWLEGKGKGWLTAEYSMMPSSTRPRKRRDRGPKTDGRTVEIQRLIGRSLRSVVAMDQFADHTFWIDCDVLDADGGTRTASITGAYVALVDAIRESPLAGREQTILTGSVAAISVGIVGGTPVLDLDYSEDSTADVDMNLVMTGSGQFIEVQGTGEQQTFSWEQLQQLIELGRKGIASLTELQQVALSAE
ncbi:Ribonuclease PH [Planctomycetes bacterium Pan216]|uniref:Ribonuclease PH n=1 Tax=Kolteria novifilia TaxID=2527975 RepID=A0A518BAU0_9BACT|nr:Ribonuclease PH [Planctomycetes bacterium Pan216]